MQVRWIRRGAAVSVAAVLIAVGIVAVGQRDRADATISTPDPWHDVDPHDPGTAGTSEPDFAAGASSLNTGGATYDVAFRVGAGGDVRLRGVALLSAASAEEVGGPYLVELFTLPCDYWPESNVVTHVTVMDGAAFVPSLVQVSSTGVVALLADGSLVSGSPTVASGAVPLDGIRFEPDGTSC